MSAVLNQSKSADDLQTQFDKQLTYLLSGQAEKDGSEAIARGRASGLAYDLGKQNLAQAIWSKGVFTVTGMPTFSQFRAGYEAHPQAFSEFHGTHFPAGGTAFSNAAGTFAYGLDVAVRGKDALAGGEPSAVGYWTEKSLAAAGFAAQAVQLNQAIISGTKLESVKAPAL